MYSKESDDDLLIARVLDKKRLCDSKNRVTYSGFLNEREQTIIMKNINMNHCFFFGGNENADRKILIFYPEKLNEEIVRRSIGTILSGIRINLPNENKGKYEHRNYLSALIKIGIERDRIGDILVDDDGADIIIFNINKEFILQGVRELTRFKKSKIQDINIDDIRKKIDNFIENTIIVPSMRCDCIVAELVGCSRNMACEMIDNERVFVNYETIYKSSKMISIGDMITIRGKGKFIISDLIRNTKNDRLVLKTKKYI